MKNSKRNNVKIGNFTADKKGILHGRIFGLGLGTTPVMFESQTSKEGKTYFRLIAEPLNDGYEVGAAFPKDKDGMEYYSVSIDSPVLPKPINGALFLDKDSGAYNLLWNRQDTGKDLKAEATVNVNLQPQQFAETQSQTPITSRRPANRQPTP